MTPDVELLPDDFDVAVIGDDSQLPEDLLAALREAAFRKAEADPLWCAENFWQVKDPHNDFGWVNFELRDYQREDGQWFIDSMRKPRQRRVVLKARQIGWTTLGCFFAWHDAYFTENHKWLIASKGEDDAEEALVDRTKLPYRRLPQWFRERGPALTNDNKETMTFDNGSAIEAIPATGSSGRSRSPYGVLYDEAAFVDEAEEMYGALDQACYGPMFVFSTANGMGNWFHGRWVESQRPDSAWEGRFRPWHAVPERGPFRTDENGHVTSSWYEDEKRKNRGQMWLLHQENPRDPEEAFAKTGRTVFNVQLLRSHMEFSSPSVVYDLLMDEGFDEPYDEPNPDVSHELWVWEEPKVWRDEHGRVVQEPNYVIGVDVSEGLEHGDRTSIDIFDANTGEQVAGYLGHWPVEHLGELIARLGYRYHTALVLPERNNMGILPIEDLRRMGYPRMWRMGPLASIPKGQKTPRYGWNTNKSTKPKAINELIRETAKASLIIRDPRFLSEAQVFIHDGRGGMNASSGNHDDKIMSTTIANQGVIHVGSYPIVWRDDSVAPVTMGEVMGLGQKKKPTNPLDEPMGSRSRGRSRESFIVSPRR